MRVLRGPMVFWGHMALACLTIEVLPVLCWTLAAPDRVGSGGDRSHSSLLMGTLSHSSAEGLSQSRYGANLF